jgi:nucleoside-diphosphate-sugar epimerase
MSMMIFGCGYSGAAIAAACGDKFGAVHGTTRSAAKAAKLAASSITPHLYDGSAMNVALLDALTSVTHLVQSIAPGPEGDPLLKLGATTMGRLMPKLQWMGYLSTVGVYGDHDGEWVDEETTLKPVSRRSVERVEAEEGWQRLADDLGLPLSVLRLSGIYGPARNTFVNLQVGTAKRLVKKDQVFNRIRVEDIGSAICFLGVKKAEGIFNVTDDEPCPPQDVVTLAAEIMGVEPPPEMPFEEAEISAMARSFYGENKRVSNRKIRSLGFQFAYPDYRMSLQDLWNCGNWQAK